MRRKRRSVWLLTVIASLVTALMIISCDDGIGNDGHGVIPEAVGSVEFTFEDEIPLDLVRVVLTRGREIVELARDPKENTMNADGLSAGFWNWKVTFGAEDPVPVGSGSTFIKADNEEKVHMDGAPYIINVDISGMELDGPDDASVGLSVKNGGAEQPLAMDDGIAWLRGGQLEFTLSVRGYGYGADGIYTSSWMLEPYGSGLIDLSFEDFIRKGKGTVEFEATGIGVDRFTYEAVKEDLEPVFVNTFNSLELDSGKWHLKVDAWKDDEVIGTASKDFIISAGEETNIVFNGGLVSYSVVEMPGDLGEITETCTLFAEDGTGISLEKGKPVWIPLGRFTLDYVASKGDEVLCRNTYSDMLTDRGLEVAIPWTAPMPGVIFDLGASDPLKVVFIRDGGHVSLGPAWAEQRNALSPDRWTADFELEGILSNVGPVEFDLTDGTTRTIEVDGLHFSTEIAGDALPDGPGTSYVSTVTGADGTVTTLNELSTEYFLSAGTYEVSIVFSATAGVELGEAEGMVTVAKTGATWNSPLAYAAPGEPLMDGLTE